MAPKLFSRDVLCRAELESIMSDIDVRVVVEIVKRKIIFAAE
jgi:hypothetical protein